MGKKLEIAKAVVGFSVQIGTGLIVGNLVSAITPAGTKAVPAFLMKVGAIGIGGALGEKAAQYTNETIDDVAAIFGVAKVAKQQFDYIMDASSPEAPNPESTK